jgi:hypothetical protein
MIWGDSEFQVRVLKFESQQPNKKSILIVPPTGGTNFLDRSYAKVLCKNGFDVFILERWTDDDEYSLDLSIHERFYARGQKAIEIALENIKSPFVAILGTSVGGIHAAIAIARFKNLNAAFAIASGASIGEIIALSDQEVLVQARKQRFEIHGFKDDQEYIEALTPHLPLEPLQLPTPPKHKQLGMVIARADTTVPTQTQRVLEQLWMPRVVVEVSGNHFFSILKTWFFHRRKIVEFFKSAAQMNL